VTKSIFVVIAMALVLEGCAGHRLGMEGYNAALVRRPDPMLPNIFIFDDAYIVLDQEPIHAQVREGRVSIAWALPYGSDFTFPDDRAIVLSASEGNPLPKDLACAIAGASAKTFVCTYTPNRGTATWKYSVRVKKGTVELERLDPLVWQEF